MEATAPPALACPDCGLDPAQLTSVVRHVEHVAGALTPVEQRQLRSHLFALLASFDYVIELPE